MELYLSIFYILVMVLEFFQMKDLKYLFAYAIPIGTFVALSCLGIYSYMAFFVAFVIIPILELLLPKVNEQYTKNQKDKRANNIFFDLLLYLNLPIIYGGLIWGFSILISTPLASYEQVGLILSLGIFLGANGINVAHELGHRKSKLENIMGKALLLPALYMHFYIEHNYGHHRHVGTPEDPVTAKRNQGIYAFWFSSVPKQILSAFRIQKQLLKSQKRTFFSVYNDMLWYTIFQMSYLALLFGLGGWTLLGYGLVVAIVSFLLLETINYIEHYGLQRHKKDSGRYERVSPMHSWNSNHIVGRIVLYELTRHSDHHFIASKKYQLLENREESPQLPYGYPTSILIALVPPLWFGLMNKRIPQ